MQTGTLKVANSEDRDEYLKIKYNNSHVATKIKPKVISRQNKTPT